jgi:hypothetical protein
MTSDTKNLEKKPYHPPVIEVYGNVAAITKTVGKSGNKDGGGGNASKTMP